MRWSARGSDVMKVAREVGTEGKLDVQAEVRDLQGISLRGFAQISAAATDGDFTRFITVEASGEMDLLKTHREYPEERRGNRSSRTGSWVEVGVPGQDVS